MKKRRRRRTAYRIIYLCIFVIVLAIAAIMLSLIIGKVKSGSEKPEYKSYSLSEEASARAYVWLNRIDDMPLTYDDIKKIIGDIELKTSLSGTDKKGVFYQTIVEGSYEECKNRADKGLLNAYRQVLEYRIKASGYENEITDDILDDAMKNAYGMSVAGYLSYCDIQLIPSYEELCGLYETEVYDE